MKIVNACPVLGKGRAYIKSGFENTMDQVNGVSYAIGLQNALSVNVDRAR